MNKYDKIICMSPCDMVEFILAVTVRSEEAILNKLSLYGIDVDVAQPDLSTRRALILKELLEEEHDS